MASTKAKDCSLTINNLILLLKEELHSLHHLVAATMPGGVDTHFLLFYKKKQSIAKSKLFKVSTSFTEPIGRE